jgi:ADP-ribose pyrophosphatase
MEPVQDRDPLFEPVKKRETLLRGGYLSLERLTLGLPDGKEAFREVVRVRDAVAVLPVDRNGTARLVRQHRAAIQRTILEAPAGILDRPDETLEACARRECVEETGLLPKRLVKLITYAHAEGYSTGFITLFLGQELQETGGPKLDQTEFVEQVSMPYPELLDRVLKNEIIDSKTILSVLLSRKHLGKY